MPTFQKILTAKHIEFPEYHKVYSIQELGNFIDYRRKNLEEDEGLLLKLRRLADKTVNEDLTTTKNTPEK